MTKKEIKFSSSTTTFISMHLLSILKNWHQRITRLSLHMKMYL